MGVARPPLHWNVGRERRGHGRHPYARPADELADALASVAAQDRPPAHTLVIDDGSAEPPRVPPAARSNWCAARRRGVSAARNAGLERVETEWVAFLDDDDLWAPPKLARQLAAADACDATSSGARSSSSTSGGVRSAWSRPLTRLRCCRASCARM